MEDRKIREENRSRIPGKGKILKLFLVLISLWTLSLWAVGGTAAFLTGQTSPVENQFQMAKLDCQVEEEFDGNKKSAIVVKNTGTTDVYIRVKLVSYRVDGVGENQHLIGGQAELPSFSVREEDWMEAGKDTYYYKYPVGWSEEPEEEGRTSNLLAEGEEILLETYRDGDGGRQVIEVMAEAIQSTPLDAVEDAWPKEVISWLSRDRRETPWFDGDGRQEVEK